MLIGRLTNDPKTTNTEHGSLKASFNLAVNGYGKRADFINIVAWGKTAENAQKYLTKGKRIAVNGRISTRDYTCSDGNKRTIFEVNADEIEYLSPIDREYEEETEEEKAAREQRVSELREGLQNEDYEELPF